MSERLVIMKSQRQLAVEGWLGVIAPIAICGAARTLADGPSFIGAAAVFVSMRLVPATSSAILNRFGKGERVTGEERTRRIVMSLATGSPLLRVLALSFAQMVLLGSMFAAMAHLDRPVEVIVLAVIAIGLGLLTGVMRYLSIRRRAANFVLPPEDLAPAQSPWAWLREYLPLHYACMLGGIFAAYLVGRSFDWPANLFLLGVGFVGGSVVRGIVVGNANNRRRELLWADIRFRAALAIAALQFGVPFAVFAALLPGLLSSGVPFMPFYFAAGGFAFGTLILLFVWAAAKLSSSGARRA
jgi:hypothetical protein